MLLMVNISLVERQAKNFSRGLQVITLNDFQIIFASDLIAVDTRVGSLVLNWRILNDTGCDLKKPAPSTGCRTVNILLDE